MEVHEEHSPFDLDISSPPPRLQMASGRTESMIGERDSKSSHHHFRSEDNELDQLVNNINHFKEPKDGPKLEGLSTHQWISMVEEEAAEISLILERLSPQTSKQNGVDDPLLRLIRRTEKEFNKRKRLPDAKDSLMTLVVDRLRTYFVNETNGMHVEMHRWYSTNDLFKWLELDSIIQQTLLEKRMRAIRVYRPPSYLNFEEHQLTMRRYEEDLIRKGVSSLKRCLNDAMEVMIDDGLLRKHRHTSVFIQPTEKLFRQGEVRVWKYEETMDMAYLLVEQRDSLQKKLNHLNYLIGCLKYVAQNNAFKQVQASDFGSIPNDRLMLPLVAVQIPKGKNPASRVLILIAQEDHPNSSIPSADLHPQAHGVDLRHPPAKDALQGPTHIVGGSIRQGGAPLEP